MKLNKEQKKAVESIDNNILVNAGAGTGKTMVLVERYINILKNGDLEEGKEVESIVAITFTKKASEEMVERIRERLREKYNEGEVWSRFYRSIQKANISTIHSFCGNILREHPIEAGIDPLFKVLEDTESEKLLKESINQVLIKHIENAPLLYNLYQSLDINNLEGFIGDLEYIYKDIRSSGETFASLREMIIENLESFKSDEDNLDEIIKLTKELMEKTRANSKINKLKTNEEFLELIQGRINTDKLRGNLVLLMENLGTSKPNQIIIDKLEDLITKELKSFEGENTGYYLLILDILEDIDKVYIKKKEDKSSLDYDDLQLKVLSLLENDSILKTYQEKYKYIMVDEFQDTNLVQKEIFYKLASDKEELDLKNLFVVGDPKQSIYGFRGADLRVYYKVMEDISRFGTDNIISLDKNYRTSKKVMGFINTVFPKLMGDKYSSLEPTKTSHNDLSIEVLENKNLEIPPGLSPMDYKRSYEADLIAKRIKTLVTQGYNYGDFAILFRSSTSYDIYEKSLDSYNIPYYNTGGKGFFYKREVLDLLNGFKSILDLTDPIANIGFLRSPMVGLNDIEIYHIIKSEGNFIDRLEDILNEKNSYPKDMVDKVARAYELYMDLLYIKNYSSLTDLLRGLIDLTDYRKVVLLKDGSRQSLGNIEKFIDLIKSYEEINKEEPLDILDYLEDLKENDQSQASVLTEGENVVKILTIHKSKGLEFPVVIIPDMGKREYIDNYKINYSKDIGIGLNIRGLNSIYEEIKKEKLLLSREEEKRVMYVAMTRAEERLILGLQGDTAGLKKLIEDIIPKDKVEYISSIDMEKEIKKSTSIISKERISTLGDGIKPINILGDKNLNIPEKKRFSISQYLTFKSCKREYFFTYYKNLKNIEDIFLDKDVPVLEDELLEDTLGLDPIIKGNIIHKFCEIYRKGMDRDKVINDICSSFSLDYFTIREGIDRYIDNFITYDRSWTGKVYKEKDFMIKLGKGYFVGAIDRINIDEKNLEIVDYKTNRLFNKEYLKSIYKPQILFYVYAIEKLFNRKVTSAKLLFLDSGEELEIDIKDMEVDELIGDLNTFQNFVTTHKDLDSYKAKLNCDKNCQYGIICR